MKPLCVDLYCGLGGWSEGFLSEGYDCIGFDIERHNYGRGGYPGQLVLQDVPTLHGSQFRNAACIVASPPCQAYSYMSMPWTRGKTMAAAIRDDQTGRKLDALNALFNACFRIQREASAAAGHYIPMVVENVKGAQPWVGRAKANFGSYYLWGDIAMVGNRIVAPRAEFGSQYARAYRELKQPGRNFHFPEKYGIPSPSFHGADHEESVQRAMGIKAAAVKNNGGSWFAQAHNTESGRSQNPVTREGVKQGGSGEAWFDKALDERRKAAGGLKAGGDWFGTYADQKAAGTISPCRLFGKRSTARKAASAQIAKIPFELSSWIARCFKPV